jgi:hypothetical protein
MAVRPARKTTFHERYDLRADGGWADLAAKDLERMGTDEQSKWYGLLDHLKHAKPRSPASDWKATESAAEIACFFGGPYSDPPVQLLAAGSDDCQSKLEDAGPHNSWWIEAEEFISSLTKNVVSRHLSSWIIAATKSNIACLNRPCPNRHMLQAIL